MKGNFKSLVDLAQEIEHLEEVKNDYVVTTDRLNMLDDNTVNIAGRGQSLGNFELTQHAAGQVADRYKIPRRYFMDQATQVPGLRAEMLNYIFRNDVQRRMIRTYPDTARAFVSDSFKPLDNVHMLRTALPVFQEFPDLNVLNSSLSETRMYLQIAFPSLQKATKVGDPVQAGIVFSNSEVGAGRVNVESLIWCLSCLNGAIGASLISKYHVGRKIGGDIEDYDIFKDDTIQADIAAFQLRLRDVLRHSLSESAFEATVAKWDNAADDKITKPIDTIENVTKRFAFTESEKELMLTGLVEGGNLSRYGLAQSITALAHGIKNVDRQYQVEKIGNDVIELKPDEWEVLQAS